MKFHAPGNALMLHQDPNSKGLNIPRSLPERAACHWKVIGLVSGRVQALSGPDSHSRPFEHESIIWQGEIQSESEALQKAAKADPRVDLKYLHIRHEDMLEIR